MSWHSLNKENVTLTLVFLLLPFDTSTWQCCLAWQWKRKHEWFWLTWFIFVFLQRMFFVICYLEMQGNLRGKNRSHFSLHSLPPLALKKREQRKQQDSRSFCHRHVRFPLSPSFSSRQSTVEALPFALLILTLNPKVFWCETCLLCVDVCFV